MDIFMTYLSRRKLTEPKNKNGGRPRKISFEDAEPILEKYFDVKIGAKETKKLLGISQKSHNTWSDLLNEYKEKHNINEFYNRIDLYESQDKRVKTLKNKDYIVLIFLLGYVS